MEFGQVGKKQSFVVYVGDAGGGELKASINGPSKAQITLTDYEVRFCENLGRSVLATVYNVDFYKIESKVILVI